MHCKIEDGKIVDTRDLREVFPMTSFPCDFKETFQGWVSVVYTNPIIPDNCVIDCHTIDLIDGVPTQVWTYKTMDISCCKECKKSEIESAWQAEISDGFKYNGDTFDFDDTTLGIIGARLSYNEASETPTTADLTFYDMDKVAVVFADKAAFKAFAIEFIVDRNTLDQKRIILKAQINACETVEAVQAITW